MKSSLRLFLALLRAYGIPPKLALDRILENRIIHIIDVGARGGYHPRWDQYGRNLKISLFEPDNEAYKELLELYKDDMRVSVYNNALSQNGEALTIHVTASGGSSSAFKHDLDLLLKFEGGEIFTPVKAIEIPSKKLSDVITADLDFIKLDVEAYELPILQGAGRLIDDLIGFEVEVSYREWAIGIPCFSDVDLFARRKGFMLAGLARPALWHYKVPDLNYRSQGFPLSTDALYTRAPHDVVRFISDGQWSSDKLYLAISLYLVYGNYEFAVVLLEDAADKKLISRESPQYGKILGTIDKRSGKHKLFPYNRIRGLRLFSPNGLDY